MRMVLMGLLYSVSVFAQTKSGQARPGKAVQIVRGSPRPPATSREIVIVRSDDEAAEAQKKALAAKQAELEAKEKVLDEKEKALEEERKARAAQQAKAAKQLERQMEQNSAILEQAVDALSGQ
jgi:Skp family chaperone for outer membrane proteins